MRCHNLSLYFKESPEAPVCTSVLKEEALWCKTASEYLDFMLNLLFFAQIRNIFEVVTLDLCYFKLIEECYLCKTVPVACIQPSFLEPRAQGTQAASPAQWCGPERFSDFPPCISVTWSSHTRWALKDRNCSTHSTMNAGTELFMWDSCQDAEMRSNWQAGRLYWQHRMVL